MSKEERSLLDELWDAAGLNTQEITKEDEKPAEEPKENEVKQEQIEEKPAKEEIIQEKEPVIEKKQDKKAKKEQKKEKKSKKEESAEKKKDIKFLVIYTIVFVVVISGLIGGSYVITSRIHQEMAENNANLNTSQSSLQNIKDENTALKAENSALKEQNQLLSEDAENANALLEGMGDMVEQDGYLTAAQSAYIENNWTEARSIMHAIDPDKLSPPAKEHYDLLKKRLGL